MTKPRLTYFDSPRSRGEECRLALVLAGVDFEDRRLAREEWPALKATTPFGGLPIFEIEGKPPVSQSNAILGYIGRRYGLFPQDDWETLRLDSLMAAAEHIRLLISGTFDIKDKEELAKKRAELADGPIKAWGASLEKQIVGPFAAGSAISVADVKLFVVAGWLKSGVLDHIPANVLDAFPKLETLYQSVLSHPKVAAWRARPESGHST
ncbi:MAG TPA: glutathione S-transferase family protein [Polyangiaceae bacterium]